MTIYGWQLAALVLVPLFVRLVYDAIQEYRLITKVKDDAVA